MECIRAFERVLGREEGCLLSTEDKWGPYHNFDFYSLDGKLWIEHKGRTFKKNDYPTTIVGKVKVDYARRSLLPRDPEARIFFLFTFTDGTYWIELDSRWGHYKIDKVRGKDHYFIPIEDLTRLE